MKKLIVIAITALLIGCATGPTRAQFTNYLEESILRSADFARDYPTGPQRKAAFVNHWNAHNYSVARVLVIWPSLAEETREIRNYFVIIRTSDRFILINDTWEHTFFNVEYYRIGAIEMPEANNPAMQLSVNEGWGFVLIMDDGVNTFFTKTEIRGLDHLIDVHGNVIELTISSKERVYL